MSITRSEFNAPVSLRYEPPFEPMGIGFCLSGQTEDKTDGFRHTSTLNPGETVFNWSNRLSGLSHTIGPGNCLLVALYFNHELISEIADRYEHKLPPPLRNPPDLLTQHKDKITPSMKETLLQVIRCPYQGLTRDLYLEGKVMELMTYKFDQLGSQDSRRAADSLKKVDLDRIYHAAVLLTKELENAPNLDQLSRSVGMCRTKLHDCFLKVYGVTPFDYLQSHRLETAKTYLLEGMMNVTEAAFAVGYSSSNYFSRAFKKYFGSPPQQYCQNQPL